MRRNATYRRSRDEISPAQILRYARIRDGNLANARSLLGRVTLAIFRRIVEDESISRCLQSFPNLRRLIMDEHVVRRENG